MLTKIIKCFGIQARYWSLFVGLFCLLFLLPRPGLAIDIIHPVQELIILTNQERLNNSLPALAINSQLTEAAHKKAADMLEKNYFDHTSPNGREPWDFIEEAGYPYLYAGENLAINFKDPLRTFHAWLNSESHHENILFPDYQEIGIATHSAEINGLMTTVTVQMFGSRQNFIPFASYLVDAHKTPLKTETLVDYKTTDTDGKSGYAVSSATTSIQRENVTYSTKELPIFLWLSLLTYLLLIIGLLFYFTQKRLFFKLIKKFAYIITGFIFLILLT